MAVVVTGLSPTGDVSALHAALAAAGLSTDALQVVSADDSSASVAGGIAGSELYTREGGTGVPGVSSAHGRSNFFRNESLSDRLGDFEIPDNEVDNYVEVLERGRSVVAYFAHTENVDRVEALFRDSSLVNVRRF